MFNGGLLKLAWKDGQIVMRSPSPVSHEDTTNSDPSPAKRPRNMSEIEPGKNIPSKDESSGGCDDDKSSGVRNFSLFLKPRLLVNGYGGTSYDTGSTLVVPSSLRPDEKTPLEESSPEQKSEAVASGGQIEGLKPSNVPCCIENLPVGSHQLGWTSSACSRVASNDVGHFLRERHEDNAEITSPNENEEQEPTSLDKLGAKRKQKTRGHNASAKKRRGRINKRLKELHHLLPSSNNVDKASMLDDAITYIKTLQLQLQMMSMGQGVYNYMSPMMLQNGSTRHIQSPQITPWHPPMGLSFGSHLPPASGGSSSAPPPPTPVMLGLQRQLVTLPCAPSVPFVGGQMPVPVPPPISDMDQLAPAPSIIGSKEKGHQNIHQLIS